MHFSTASFSIAAFGILPALATALPGNKPLDPFALQVKVNCKATCSKVDWNPYPKQNTKCAETLGWILSPAPDAFHPDTKGCKDSINEVKADQKGQTASLSPATKIKDCGRCIGDSDGYVRS